MFIIPGRIEFARIPDRAYCRAMTRVNWITAAFVAA
jgi:hypothetical protein